ncbi:MAG: putative serine/threonine-protein kinase unc-51, partial [Streblomastix strix]
QGAFGLVFLVASTETGLMAAKVMQSQVFDPIEWDAAGRLQEKDPIPFIVQFKFARQFDDLVVILMEFANLKSLDHIIKRNYDLSGGTVRAIAKQLFEGLKLIHAKGLVHRDIKGENIMMHCPPGSQRVIVKIGDFGLVKIQNLIQRTMLMSAKGTPLNMAPELVIGDRKADSKVDIWSVGVVLYQLVAHQYPIKATSVPELQTTRPQIDLHQSEIIYSGIFF